MALNWTESAIDALIKGGTPEELSKPSQANIEALLSQEKVLEHIMPKRKPSGERLSKAHAFLSRCRANGVFIRIMGHYPGVKAAPKGFCPAWLYKGVREFEREIAWFSRFSEEECDRLWEEYCSILRGKGIDPDPTGVFKDFCDVARREADMLKYRDRLRTFYRNRVAQARYEVEDTEADGAA